MRPQESLPPPHRLLIYILAFILMAGLLKTGWNGLLRKSERGSEKVETGLEKEEGGVVEVPMDGEHENGNGNMVFAHFMLGNTYPYTETDWSTTLTLAQSTHLTALILNLGPEPWQLAQLQSAYKVLENINTQTNSDERDALKLAISLDMMVLPGKTEEDMGRLVDAVVEAGKSSVQLRIPTSLQKKKEKQKDRKTSERRKEDVDQDEEGKGGGKVFLSTFGGQDASFGGRGWSGFKEECSKRGVEIFFAPAFFLPPSSLLKDPSVDATFNWNSGWPMGDHSILEGGNGGEEEFLKGDKPYMATVSPWFFTHYGKEGAWAWDKNWIYRSDDNLYPTRWNQILEMDPSLVCINTWNDYGESHYIGPISGAQPGSEPWTTGMDHEGWRLMTKDFARMYRGLGRDSGEDKRMKVYLTYRTMVKDAEVEEDRVGRPDHAEWAQDVIGIYILGPTHHRDLPNFEFRLTNGEQQTSRMIQWDRRGQFLSTVDFIPGRVEFVVMEEGGKVVLFGKGADVQERGEVYNFNAWTGHWEVDL